VTKVRSFMGFAGYYRRFIEGFSKIAHPIISLQKKGVKFKWTLECEKSFQHLKHLLTNTPILRIVDPNEYFIVCTDACRGLGGLLSKNGYVVCYETRKLKDHERNYATHDLKLVAIVHALKKWRHYLIRKMFELRIDHDGLKYLFDHKTLNARKRRWLEFLSEYEFDINHIKGKEKKVVDALIRRVHELHVIAISMYQLYLKEIILEAAKLDLQYIEIITKIQQGILQQKNEHNLENDEIIMYRGIIYVLNSWELKILIFIEMHNIPYARNLGVS
jgi:hypothetical protein